MFKSGLIPNEQGKVYHLFMGATKLGLHRLGINTGVTLFGEKIAKERGFKYLLSESTSPGT
jgi:hypothetical protein